MKIKSLIIISSLFLILAGCTKDEAKQAEVKEEKTDIVATNDDNSGKEDLEESLTEEKEEENKQNEDEEVAKEKGDVKKDNQNEKDSSSKSTDQSAKSSNTSTTKSSAPQKANTSSQSNSTNNSQTKTTTPTKSSEPKPVTQQKPSTSTQPKVEQTKPVEQKPVQEAKPVEQPKPEPKPEPKPVKASGYDSTLTNQVNGSINMNIYGGSKKSVYSSLVQSLASGGQSVSSATATVNQKFTESGMEYTPRDVQVYTFTSSNGNTQEIINTIMSKGLPSSHEFRQASVYYNANTQKYTIAVIGLGFYKMVSFE